MNYEKEMLNKEVAVWYISHNELTIFFTDGSDMRIRHGNYTWRVIQNGDIIMSSADIFAQFADSETAAFWPMQEKADPDTVDFDEYMEEMFDALENHKDNKSKICKNLLEGTTVASFKVCKNHDISVSFSNGATLEVFAMIEHNFNCQNECNILNLFLGERKKDTVIIL